MTRTIPKVAFLLQNVGSGGVERVTVNLLKELVKYPISLELVLFEKCGNFLHEVPPEVRIIELLDGVSSGRLRRALPLMRYLRQEKPNILISQLVQFNVLAAIAKVLSGISLRLILVEHLGFDTLEDQLRSNPNEKIYILDLLRYVFYRKSDVIAAVSQGLAEELERRLGMSSGRIKVLYNPVLNKELTLKAQASVEHIWFQPGQPPVFLSVGRLAPQKDFSTLIQAFSILRQKHLARLMILGEGDERSKLEAIISQLNLTADVALPGFTDNPYAYMNRATAFVLSSRFEALPTVLIEALACGCPVISTDCPHGPNEILMSGKYGKLVPLGNAQELANAMEEMITNPKTSRLLQSRAEDFKVENAVSKYLEEMKLSHYHLGKAEKTYRMQII